MGQRKMALMTQAMLMTSLVLLIAHSNCRAALPARYAVLVDAGSTRSKVKVYRYTQPWGAGSVDKVVLPNVELLTSVKVKPGLSSVMGNTVKIRHYLERLVNATLEHVPKDVRADTPFFLSATAGLRTLAPTAARQLLGFARAVLRTSGGFNVNPFRFRDDQVAILSGEEEAAYSWLALNALHGYFRSNMARSSSVGLLEIGGGSLQVAFLPEVPLYQEEFQIYVGRRRVDLYATSYLGFGFDYLHGKVRQELIDEAAKAGDTTGVLRNPCMMIEDSRTEGGRTEQGTSEPDKCQVILDRLLQPAKNSSCSPRPCTIGSRYQPPFGNLDFYATSAFRYAPTELNAVDAGGKLNVTRLKSTAHDFCKLNLTESAESWPDIAPELASMRCLQGLYIPALLQALGFELGTTRITVAGEIDGQSVDWALGQMLQQLSTDWMRESRDVSSGSANGPRWLPFIACLNAVAVLFSLVL